MTSNIRTFSAFWWRPFPANRNYLVREDGAVMRLGGRILSPCVSKRGGYLAVSLWQKNRGKLWPVHQMVCLAFHGDRPSREHQVAHGDGNRTNNHYSNLRWATRRENEADKVLHGRSNRGDRNPGAKIDEVTAARIKDAFRAGERGCAIARRFGLSQSHVALIKSGSIWRHVA